MTTAVVGLGKIGLPLGVAIAGAGEPVVGLDISTAVVDLVSAGEPPFPGEPDLDRRLRDGLSSGAFRATTDAADAVSTADQVIIVVPLVVDDEGCPDFGAMDAATEAVAPHLAPGVLVAYETTVPVGTTRHRYAPMLAEISGLAVGQDLFVCHSPERVSSGRVFADLRQYPKLVGGVDQPSEDRGVSFYASVLEFDPRPDLPQSNGVWPLGGAEAAELAKLAETTYRDVNIAFANELALAAERIGVDVGPVIDACNSQPFSHIHQPGIYVGGHCIPVYPHLLMSSVEGLRLPAVAREVNEGMPEHAVKVLEDAIGSLDGQTVAVLGLAFRPGVKEDFHSGAYRLVGLLESRGATGKVHDPLYTDAEIAAKGLVPYALGEPAAAWVIHTAHPEYDHLQSFLPGLIYDGRGWHPPASFEGQTLSLGRGATYRASGVTEV